MLKKLKPPQIIVISFLSAILIGTVLLSLPLATSTGERTSIVDSLFTATSATCVTGLIVKDTGTYFSGFGRFVILALLGGLVPYHYSRFSFLRFLIILYIRVTRSGCADRARPGQYRQADCQPPAAHWSSTGCWRLRTGRFEQLNDKTTD